MALTKQAASYDHFMNLRPISDVYFLDDLLRRPHCSDIANFGRSFRRTRRPTFSYRLGRTASACTACVTRVTRVKCQGWAVIWRAELSNNCQSKHFVLNFLWQCTVGWRLLTWRLTPWGTQCVEQKEYFWQVSWSEVNDYPSGEQRVKNPSTPQQQRECCCL